VLQDVALAQRSSQRAIGQAALTAASARFSPDQTMRSSAVRSLPVTLLRADLPGSLRPAWGADYPTWGIIRMGGGSSLKSMT
jgi:hypothetical protein